MSAVLGKYLISLNVERLEIKKPVFDYFNESKFKALYQAIYESKLKYFSIINVLKRADNILGLSEFPLDGIDMFSKSHVESIYLGCWGGQTGSTLSDIVRELPTSLRELAVNL